MNLEKNFYNYLCIDPSGSGTTGLFFYNSKNDLFNFFNYSSKNWKDHFLFIKKICEENKIDFIIYESTDYVKVKGKDFTNLLGLFGSIEALSFLKEIKCFNLYVKDIKTFYKKILINKEEIKYLILKKGRGGGWFWKNKKINLHELDSLIIFYLYIFKNDKEIFSILFS